MNMKLVMETYILILHPTARTEQTGIYPIGTYWLRDEDMHSFAQDCQFVVGLLLIEN